MCLTVFLSHVSRPHALSHHCSSLFLALQASTPPSSWYLSSEILQREMSLIFTRRWVCVGQLGSLKEPGSFLSGLYMDMPWVVTRHAEDNQLRAFHNVSLSCEQHDCCDRELVLGRNITFSKLHRI